MEENKKTTKKKLKQYLPIIIIAVILLLCAASTGVVVFNKFYQREVEEGEKAPEEIKINPNCMTVEEVEQLEDLVENLTEEEKAALQAEADSGVQDELTLRKLLLLEDEISIKVSKDIEIIATMPVKGKKTLTGEATIQLFLGAEVENNSILSVKQGAELAVEGLVLDASGVSSAVVVADGATFNFMSGEIQYGTAYGIHNKGTVYVSGGTISESWGAAIGVESGAKTYISGGNLVNSVKNILWIAKGGSVEVTGGVLDTSYEYAVVNNGTFKMTGGTIKGANGGVKGYALWNNATAVIDGGSDYVEISDCAYGFYNSGMASTLTLNKVYWHDNTGYIGNVKKGTATITNCKFANTGTRGLIITDAVVEINNVEMTNIGETAFAVYKPSKVTAKNVTVNGVVNGNGYANYGADSVLENITMNNVSSTAFYITSSTDTGTGEPGTITLKNCSASNSNSNVLLKHGSKVIADGCAFGETARTNVMLSKGTAQFTNAKLFGAIADDCSVLSIQKDASANLNNVEIAQGNRGIYLAGALTMKGGSIHDNEGIMQGCALSVAGTGTFTLDGVDIYNNKITNLFAGGGLYLNNDASGKVLNSTIKNNTILGDGGAVYTGKATLEMQNCTIEGNTSSQGGAIYTKAGTVTLRGCTITNNASVGNTTKKWASKGGAIKTDKEANVTIDGCYFANNNASQAGAIFHGPGTLTISGGTVFENHTVTTNTGAVYSEGTLVDNGSIYRNNVVDGAGAGGAVRIEKGTATITGSKFYDSTTLGDGGAIYAKGALNLKGCEFDGSLSSQGAAIYLNNSGDEVSTISGCTFTNNKAVGYEPKSYEAKGGAICNNKGTLKISDGTIFKNNTSLKNSAAIFNKGTLVDSGSTYIENVVTGNGAGGAIRNEGGTATINGSVFTKNSTNEDGGAIYTNKPITVTNSTFTENTAARGGAIYCNVADASTISGCTFKGNTANGSSAHGGAIFIRNGEISDSTFTSNVAECGRDILVNSNATETVLSGTNTFDANGNHVYLLTSSSNVQATVTLAGKATGLNVIYTSDNIGIKLDDAFDQTSTVTMIPDGYQSEIQVVGAVQEASSSFANATQKIAVVLPNGDKDCALTTKGYLDMACVAIGDTKYSSLAAAVNAANNGDTIEILKDFTVASTIEIDKSLTIKNAKEVTITSSVGLSGNMFKVAAGATLTMEGLADAKINIDGNAGSSATKARAVYVEAAVKATESTEAKDAGKLVMTNVAIQNFYTSANAVAVLNLGTAELTNVNIKDNITTSGSAGGAIRNEGTMTIANSNFSGNESKYLGGAIYAKGGTTTTITNTQFTENAGSNGGAIYFNSASGTLTISDNCTFTGNTATGLGGAIAAQRVNLANATFASNTAGTAGNDVYLMNEGTPYAALSGKMTGLTVTSSRENATIQLKGDYDITSQVTVIPEVEGEYQIIANNGLTQADFETAIENMTLVGDNLSGTWSINNEGCLTKDYCVQLQATGEKYYSLSEAVAAAKERNGDDVIVILSDFAVGSAVTIDSNITITSETGATITRGSGVTGNMFNVTAGNTLTIQGASKDAHIIINGNAGNSAVNTRAVNVEANATFNMEYVTIQKFYSNSTGAAISSYGDVNIANSEVSENTYTGTSVGGIIRIDGTPKVSIKYSTFSNNKSGGAGGVLRVNKVNAADEVTITECTFSGNTSEKDGGAIYYNDANAPIVITNCTFTGNSAVNGGAISARRVTINGATFTSNTASTAGNDVHLRNGSDYVTLSGKLTGLTVQYAANNVGVRIGGAIDESSDITIIPTEYFEGVQVVAAESVDEDTFKAATKLIKVAPDENTGDWKIHTTGCLTQGESVHLASTNKSYYNLQEALEEAADKDTITLLRSLTVGSPIEIAKTLTIVSNAEVTIRRGAGLTGNMFNVTAGTLTIQGSEGKEIVIDGNAESSAVSARAVNVAAGATFKMTYGTIQNFNSSLNAMAVLNGGTTELTNVNVVNNASASAGSGQAMRNNSGAKLTVTNSYFENNTGKASGGVLYATGTSETTFTGCTFKGNATTGSNGGAIHYNGSKTLTVTDCTFEENGAGQNGGAIYNNVNNNANIAEKVSISGCTFKNNEAVSKGGAISIQTEAGAVITAGQGAVISNSTFESNTAATGDNVYLSAAGFVTLSGKLTGLTVQYTGNNVGVKIGGAIDTASDITITPAAYTEGSQLVAKADDTVTDDVFAAAAKLIQVTPGEAGAEWGIDSEGYLAQLCATIGEAKYYSLNDAVEAATSGDTISLVNSFTLRKNITISEAKTVNIVNGTDDTITITRNTTGDMIYLNNSSAVLNITGNTGSRNIIFEGGLGAENATAANVRCVWVEAGTFNLTNAGIKNFYSNRSNAGPAVYSKGTVVLDNTDIINNGTTTTYAGGALRNYGGSMTIKVTTLQGNTASNSEAGALYTNNANVTLEDCTFDGNASNANGNTSAGRGGAIYYNGATQMEITGCTFTGNHAANYGGALWVQSVKLSGCTFESNYTTAAGTSSTLYGGGAIWLNSGSLTCTNNCVFKGNYTDGNQYSHGGAIYANSAALIQIDGCQFTGNFTRAKYGNSGSDSHGGAIYIETYTNTDSGYINNCNFTSNIAGYGDGTGNGAGAVGNNGSGGAVGINAATSFNISGCTFTTNKADNRGGAIYTNGSTTVLYLYGCEFDGNASMRRNPSTGAAEDYGGAMQAYSGTIYYDTACIFKTSTDTINGSGARGTVTPITDSAE